MSLKNDFGAELIRNMVGMFLIVIGMISIGFGAHWHMAELVTLGTLTLIPAALLALQSKRSPDGNTTTTSVTIPPPDVATAIPIPASKDSTVPKV